MMKSIVQHINRYFLRYSFYTMLVLMGFAWGYISYDQPSALSELFQPQNWDYLSTFIQEMLGIHEEMPAYLQAERWQAALWLSLDTLLMSLIATAIATGGMLLFVLFAVRNFSLNLWYFKPLYWLSRGLFVFSRAVPELMWAMILVFIFKAGVFAGALALAIHNFGILGKLCAEVVENLDQKPLQHLKQNGASYSQLLFYGIYPAVMPAWLNYILYRFENMIRATLIVGVVGASGLGMEFKLAMSFFHYSDMLLYLLCYLGLVYLVDLLSGFAKGYINPKQ